MERQLDKTQSSRAIWLGAITAAFVGAWLLYDANPGVNWPLWVATASLALVFARRMAGRRLDPPLLILLGWATVLASAAAVSSADGIPALVILSVAMLLGLAVIVIGEPRWRSLSAKLLPIIPFLAPGRVWKASFGEAASAPANISSAKARPAVRGAILTVPIVIVLLALLRNADPTISLVTTWLTSFLPDWSFPGRVIFFLVLLSVTLGATSLAARQTESSVPVLPSLLKSARLGFTEQRMILIAVAVLLWLFVLLQVSYLFRSPPSAAGSGVSFADYARRGFAELSIAVTLVGGVIIGLEASRVRDDSRNQRTLVRLELALIVALELILLSAFRRVILYEQAFGFTTARIFAQVYMVVIGLGLLALLLEIRKGGITIDLGRRLAVIALGAFTVFAFWNFEAWIMNRNIDRARSGSEFDVRYARRLSWDAIPTIVARRKELTAADQAGVNEWLGCLRQPEQRHWYELNLRTRSGVAALQTLGSLPCPKTPAPVPGVQQPVPANDSASYPVAPAALDTPLGRTNR
jgi:hypothetical protein